MLSQEDYQRLNHLSNAVIGAAIEVHKELGPGLLESAYEECLKTELTLRGMKVESQVELPIIYKGVKTEKCYRLDLMVEDELIVEIKAVENMLKVHEIQLVT